ncbi:MAG: DUF2953 domain-containing protein [Oscillospiraceae bacterium]|jgi:hypothetical protein|nr:DUF2953 domain-containing protein [Oscillospiraceae bacterium]
MLVMGIILSALLLLGFTRFGIRAKRTADGKFRLILRAGFLRIDLVKYQQKAKRKKKPDKPVKKEKEAVETRETLSRDILWRLFSERAPILRSLRRGVRIDRMELNLTVAGGDDPCDAAILYWRLHMAWGILRPLIHENLRVKKQRVEIGLNFDIDKTRWEGEFAMTFSLGRSLAVLFAVMRAAMKQDTANHPRKAV